MTGAWDRDRLPVDAPNRWVDPTCDYCEAGAPCLLHDRRPRTLAQNRVIFGPSFGYEPTAAYREEAAFPWA
jgi:hypothetical protein